MKKSATIQTYRPGSSSPNIQGTKMERLFIFVFSAIEKYPVIHIMQYESQGVQNFLIIKIIYKENRKFCYLVLEWSELKITL